MIELCEKCKKEGKKVKAHGGLSCPCFQCPTKYHYLCEKHYHELRYYYELEFIPEDKLIK